MALEPPSPLWWGGLPAILKGWFDRVCAYGVTYADGKRFDKGYFVGRRAMLGLTTGGTLERFSPGGSYGEWRTSSIACGAASSNISASK